MEKKKYIIHNSILTANWVLIFRKSPWTKNTTQSHTHTRAHTQDTCRVLPRKAWKWWFTSIWESSVGKPKHGTFIHIPNLEGKLGTNSQDFSLEKPDHGLLDRSWSAALPTEAFRASSWDVGEWSRATECKGEGCNYQRPVPVRTLHVGN